jgi:hypothetical protein
MIWDEFLNIMYGLYLLKVGKAVERVVKEPTSLNYQTARRYMPETINLVWRFLVRNLRYYK